MKDQLKQYVDLLFAGSPENEDMKQEILQNTLDKYDDYIDQGKTPEAAYRLAISGIGDVNEVLSSSAPVEPTSPVPQQSRYTQEQRKHMRATAIGMYIASVIPVIALNDIGNGAIGVCLMFMLLAAATVLIILASREEEKEKENEKEDGPKHPIYKALSGAVTLAIYLLVSFASGAWHITWLIFPISAAIDGIVKAIFQLKGEHHEP